ncbi:OmpA family protein [Robertkochia solimangrovi]|uniref:OmpA family protein n=1 Tax=Robertkochia solimangrovi TaxID=2213046 RepID=UPI00117E72BB|nr:OmpA family protein [Robertkochia solimangrovi]TRZ42525.1 hypothetical protein DMZ48_13570 [Robertkochia solimangrovi]
MKNLYFYTCLLCIFASNYTLLAQRDDESATWYFGIGYNVVDDSGREARQLFDISKNWNYVWFPSTVTAGYMFNNGFRVTFMGNYNQYKDGKQINLKDQIGDEPFWAFDGLVEYGLNIFYRERNRNLIDPFLSAGFGYTSNDAAYDGMTFDAGGGLNLWIDRNWAISMRALGKWGIGDNKNNYKHYSIGVLLTPDLFKRWSMRRAGRRSVSNSTSQPVPPAYVPDTTPDEPVVEDTPVETEPAVVTEPVVPPAPTKSEEELLWEEMEEELGRIAIVYYAFDSSYLTEDDKAIVEELVEFMNKYPRAKLDIQAHADSRGSADYNMWLSQKRGKRIVDYIVSKGIDEKRLTYTGFGETQLVNRCADGVPCSAEEQRQNRRTKYVLIRLVNE